MIWVFGMSNNLGSPVYGNTVVTAVTLAIGENGSKIAYFSHSAGRAHAQLLCASSFTSHQQMCELPF